MGVRRWITSIKQQAFQTQHVISILGRRRHLPFMTRTAQAEYRWKSERAAVNFGIQGSAADIVLAAMLQLWRHPWLTRCGFRLVMQVHDEFVLEGPEDRSAEAVEVVRDAMMNPFRELAPGYKFKVPLTADVGIGKSFGV